MKKKIEIKKTYTPKPKRTMPNEKSLAYKLVQLVRSGANLSKEELAKHFKVSGPQIEATLHLLRKTYNIQLRPVGKMTFWTKEGMQTTPGKVVDVLQPENIEKFKVSHEALTSVNIGYITAGLKLAEQAYIAHPECRKQIEVAVAKIQITMAQAMLDKHK